MSQDDPHFVMSMFANKEELYKAKAKYYMEKSDKLELLMSEVWGLMNDDELKATCKFDEIEELFDKITDMIVK